MGKRKSREEIRWTSSSSDSAPFSAPESSTSRASSSRVLRSSSALRESVGNWANKKKRSLKSRIKRIDFGKACRFNHSKDGRVILDGCLGFVPALGCRTCGCHRNFHNLKAKVCQKNLKATIGEFGTHYCRNFIPSEICAACGCHKVWHRKAVSAKISSEGRAARTPEVADALLMLSLGSSHS